MTVLKFRISVPTIMIIVRYPVIIIVNIVFFKIFFPLLFIGSLIFWRSFTGSLVISIEWEPFNWYYKIYKIFNTLPLTQSNLKRSSMRYYRDKDFISVFENLALSKAFQRNFDWLVVFQLVFLEVHKNQAGWLEDCH